MEENLQYSYSDKIWTPCPTVADGDCFFHSVFGTKDEDGEPYCDKYANFRRMYWATFLTYYSSSEFISGELLEVLNRSFIANDKYLHKRVNNPDTFTEYIKDIAVSDYWVMVEEIPVHAALQNIKIILFIDNQEKPETFEPDPEILGNFPFRSILPEREVVICLVNNHFSRLCPYVESTIKKVQSLNDNAIFMQEENENPYFNRKRTFSKLGSAGLSGGLYQVNLLTMVLLNGLRQVAEWRLSSEDRNAARFDDLIFEYLPSETAIMLQAKHKKDKIKNRITYQALISSDFKSDFSLPKYFVSYQHVKRNFKVRNVVLCTDAGFDEKTTKDILVPEITSPESVLYFEGSENTSYSLTRSSFPNLKEQILIYCDRYKKENQAEISDQDIDDFLSDFRLFPNCFKEGIVDKVIEETMSQVPLCANLDSKAVFKDIHRMMIDWFTENKGRYLTQVEAKAFFCDIRSNKYCERLNQHDISFKQQNRPFIFLMLEKENLIRIEHIIPEEEYIINVVKVYQALPIIHKSKVLFVNPDETIEVQKQIIEAFIVAHYTILIIVCPKTIEEDIATEICSKLMEILNHYKYKRVILIAKERNNLALQIKTVSGDWYKAWIDNIKFTDLGIDTQEQFKQRKNINFQGSTMSLKELFKPSTNEVLNPLVNSVVLGKLSRDEIIDVGQELRHLDNYYVHRNFKRNGRIIPEEDICHSGEISDEKVILISDTAGMGKSTVLASLALSIKTKSPHLWVFRFDLKSYTNIMEKILTQGGKSISIAQLLDSQETTKLKSEFEKKLFATRDRVVLLLDGVDEVSKYTELVKNLLTESLNQINLAKIFVTSRPNQCKDFEKYFKLKSFKLMPFTEDDQIHFLTKYWIQKLNLEGRILKQRKCKIYAEYLIQKVSEWLGEQYGNTFYGIPRQTRMIAELFQEKKQICDGDIESWEGCKEFLSSENDQPKLPEELNLIQLYETFIAEKRVKFTHQKFNTSTKTAANVAPDDDIDIEKYLELHRSLSMFSEHFRL